MLATVTQYEGHFAAFSDLRIVGSISRSRTLRNYELGSYKRLNFYFLFIIKNLFDCLMKVFWVFQPQNPTMLKISASFALKCILYIDILCTYLQNLQFHMYFDQLLGQGTIQHGKIHC